MRIGGVWVTLAAVVAVMVGATSALGASLQSIGVLDAGNPLSQVNAITPDGQYAVGLSQNGTVNYPVVWSSSGLVQLPNAAESSGTVTEARGVIVRAGDTEDVIGVAGYAPSGMIPMQWYEAPVSNVAGSSWNEASSNYTPGPYNAARLDGGSTWYIAGENNTSNEAVRWRINGEIAADWQGGQGEQVARSVSNNSVGVGYHSPSSTHAACYWDIVNYNAGFHAIPGSRDYSEGYGISSDGTVMSGLDGTSSTNFEAFVWKQGDAGMTLLGKLLGDTQSAAITVNANKTAGGYSSDGSTERAVIWDTTGVWDSSGQPMLLIDLLDAAGVNVDAWSSLTRVTTMTDDGKTVAGWGVWAADGSTRGFIATIPEPTTWMLLGLGGLWLSRRRRGAYCAMTLRQTDGGVG